MNSRFDYGDAVRVTRNVRNDGTYPGMSTGDLLVRRGSIGYVRDVGTFLQDQVIYTIHFLDAARVVGCREEELISADSPWIPSRFEFREKVRVMTSLSVAGRKVVEKGSEGEIIKVVREHEQGVVYNVLFHDQLLVVPERVLEPREPRDND